MSTSRIDALKIFRSRDNLTLEANYLPEMEQLAEK